MPDCSCMGDLTSTNSPISNRRSVSFSCEAFSFAPAVISKSSVSSVSFLTLKMLPPSLRYSVPWLPDIVTQPSAPSFRACTFTRRTSISLSLQGTDCSIRTSFTSNLRTTEDLLLTPSVRVVLFTTFMHRRRISCTLSSSRCPSESQEHSKQRSSSSLGMSTASPLLHSLPHLAKKFRKEVSFTTRSLPLEADIASKTASFRRSLAF
mmetsp:Transcript_17171/g.37966  ORF Transcript_17171/g.37966 Transcript_17171/m.37966 type:complete len:207 (-) Transcript_17171:2022-2642(-)